MDKLAPLTLNDMETINEKIILKLLETREYLVKGIEGNYANMKTMQEINQPQIDRIDKIIETFRNKETEKK